MTSPLAEPGTTGSTQRDLRALPKAELHVHLLGAMRPATLVELTASAGLPAADPRGFSTFAEFQQTFQAVFEVLTRPGHLARLVREVVADAAADGVVWVQPHFDPHIYPQLGPPEQVMELVLDAGRDEGARRGVGFGLTMAAMRHLGPQAAADLARFAGRYAGHGVHAFGLTGDEAAFPGDPFAGAFAVARDAGLTAAPHAGELSGPESVRTAVLALGAQRIAHGVRAAEDPAVLAMLAERDVTLDVCLSSNLLLGVVPAMSQHPLPRLLAAGVRCSLGADDPLPFGVGLLDEYRIARSELGLPDHQLAALARTSVETSGAPASLIRAATARIDSWLAGPAGP
ncbi:MAG TPA: adenosine deaminase [Streptosporangiaceae bacterium]|nr:adenosine deaminase [Streptosporangiaceae bacterium]